MSFRHGLMVALSLSLASGALGQGTSGSTSSDRPASSESPPLDRGLIVDPSSSRLSPGGVYAPNVMDVVSERIRAQADFLIGVQVARNAMLRNNILEFEVAKARLRYRLFLIETRIVADELRFKQQEQRRDLNLQEDVNQADRKETRLTKLETDIAQVAQGRVLNDLLSFIPDSLLSGTELAQTAKISLPDDVKEHMTLLLGYGRYEAKVSLDGKEFLYKRPKLFESSPYAVEEERLRRAYDRMVRDIKAGEDTSDDDFDQATRALEELAKMRRKEYAAWKESLGGDFKNTTPEYIGFKEAETFVEEQYRQMIYLANASDMPQGLAGDTLQDLVMYMKKNGFRFGPAPSDQSAAPNTYKAVYDGLVALHAELNEKGLITEKGTDEPRYRSATE